MINFIKKWFSKKSHNEKIIYTKSVESIPVVDSVEIISEIPEEIEEEIEVVEVSEDEEKFLSLSKEMTMNRNSIYSEIIEFIPTGIRTSVMNLNIIQRNQMFLRYLGCPKRTLHENDKMWSDLKNIDIRKMTLPEIEKAIKSLWDYLNPSENDKKKYGEVFTPFDLVNEMLDKLPVEVWSNPKLKWLEPANGVGNFAIVIIKRLMIGLEGWEPDEEKRYKHIIENMIYVCELQPKNMFIWLFTIDPSNKYDVKFYRESFLGDGFNDKMKEWGVEKFDVIISNPPYNDEFSSGNSLWSKFIIDSIKLLNKNGILSKVVPGRWILPGYNIQKGRVRIWDIFNKMNPIHFNIGKCSTYFNGVGSDSEYFSYFVVENTKNAGKTIVVSNTDKFTIDTNKTNCLPYKGLNSTSTSILTKVLSKDTSVVTRTIRKLDLS